MLSDSAAIISEQNHLQSIHNHKSEVFCFRLSTVDGRLPSIFRNAGIDFVGPGENSALQVEDFFESGFAQEVDGFGGALAAAAMRDDFARSVELMHAPRNFAERNQFPVEIADLIFVRFAHVENKKIIAFVETSLQLLR